MSEFIKVASVSDLQPDAGICVNVQGRKIGLFKIGDDLFAVDDTCTHADASLCDGYIAGTEVVCPLHAATFDLRTGEATAPPADEDLQTYVVRINGEDVELQI